MPFDILNYLLNEFNKTDKQLSERESGSVDQKEYEAFKKLHNTLIAAERFKETLYKDAKPLTILETNMASQFIDDFVNEFEAFSQESSDSETQPARDFCKGIEYTLFALKAQNDSLKAASKLEDKSKMPTMNDIMSDYSWVRGVFKTDPNAAEYKKEPKTNWNASEHSADENIKKYKECMQELPGKFLDHVSNVTGDTSDPMKSFGDKVKLVQLALDSAEGGSGNIMKFSNVDRLYNRLLKGFNVNELSSMDFGNLVSDDSINAKIIDYEFKDDVMSGDIDKLELSKESKDAFKDAVRKLKISSYNLGIDPETMQALNETTSIYELINHSVSFMLDYNGGVDPYKENDAGSPLYEMLKTADEISRKAVNYIKGAEGAEPVNDEDIKKFITAMGDGSINTNPVDEQGQINYNFDVGMQNIKAFVEKFPQFSEIYSQYQSKYLAKKEEYKKQNAAAFLRKLTSIDATADDYNPEVSKYENLKDSGYLDDAIAKKTDFFIMCRNADLRDELMQSGTPEERALCSVLDYEFRCAMNYQNSDRKTRSGVKSPYNRTIVRAMTPDYIFNEEDLSNFDAYYTSLMNFIPKDKDELDKLLESGICGELFYRNNADIIRDLSTDQIDTLTQSSGNFYTSNSEEYKSVGDALQKYANEVRNNRGASGETCKALYEACTTYMYTHDSSPATPNGKRRFNAAASVMAKIIPELLQKNPDMYDLVERDVKINMIRSQSFRDEIVNNNIAKFGEMGRDIDKVLKTELGKSMITGKLPTDELKDALLTEFNNLDISYFKKVRSSRMESALSEDGMKISNDKSFHF